MQNPSSSPLRDRPPHPAAEAGPVVRSLLADGSLILSADPDAWSGASTWAPRSASPSSGPGRATIVVRTRKPDFAIPAGAPAFELRGVLGWLEESGDVLLRDAPGRVAVRVSLDSMRAEARIPGAEEAGEASAEIFAALTLSAAFLLGRLGRTLVHAGAVVAPDGRAWLLVGGSFSGKSTTCVNLIRAGWDYLADDHVVLGRNESGDIVVEGWPRRFNLDEGYAVGTSTGVRARVAAEGFGPGRWRRAAPLAGLLFPRVSPDDPTALSPLGAPSALASLLRQCPWLLADRVAAPAILALLESAARRPAHELRLGLDSFGDPGRLEAALLPWLGA